MRLRAITLANFKSFAGEAEVPLGQSTSLIGPNGAGKSCILCALQNMAAILSGGTYLPKKSDYFDDNDGAEMRLGAEFELSDAAQQALLARPKPKSAVVSPGLEGGPLFRHAKYTAAFQGDAMQRQEIYLSDDAGDLKLFVRASLEGSRHNAELRHIGQVDLENRTFPDIEVYRHQQEPFDASYLFGKLDHSLFPAVQGLFSSLRLIPTNRGIPPAVPVRQGSGLTPSGQNLPNELNDLRRSEQDDFDKYMDPVTHGDPLGVEPRTVGSDLALEVREKGLTRRANHADIGSGQLQTIVIGWQMFRQSGKIAVPKEPELHLHAERQRQVFRLIRDRGAKDNIQFVIETHSPVFLGAGHGERVILVTKDTGKSRITEISPDNVDLIRRELGITHADTLHPTNILFTEGLSDLAVFAPLLKATFPDHAYTTAAYTMHGAHKAKNLGMLIEYLATEGRRIFIVLDDDDGARAQVKELEKSGRVDGNYHFLEKSLEDEFDSNLLVGAVRDMAAEAGCAFTMTADELDASRSRGEAVSVALKRHWDAKKCGPISKVRLAERLVGMLDGQVPCGIDAALRAAVSYFEGGGSGDRGAKPASAATTLGGRS